MPTLIHTIGKRDLQFDKGVPSDIYEELLEANTEDQSLWVIRQKSSYRELTQKLLHKLKWMENPAKSKLLAYVRFPMMEQAIEHVKKEAGSIDRLVICPTDQPTHFRNDTVNVGVLIEKYMTEILKQKFSIPSIEIRYLNIVLAPESPKAPIYQFVAKEVVGPIRDVKGQTYISHRQGLPDVSLAFILAGLYQDFRYLIPSKNGPIKEENLKAIEQMIDQYQRSPIA